jgi:hypothetical protein
VSFYWIIGDINRSAEPFRTGSGSGIIALGVVIGAILGGVLLCVTMNMAADWEQQAIEQEVCDGVAKGQAEEEARELAVMSRHRMPIAAAMGFFMELAVAVVVGGGIGGVLAAKWEKRSSQQEESFVAWRVVGYEHSPDPPPAGSTTGPLLE